MRKYLFIYKSEVMSQLQYAFNILVDLIAYFIFIFIFFNLWSYLYSDPSQLINGYSMDQMIWYVVITELLWNILGGRKYSIRISDDVRSGNVAYNMNKPYSYIGYLVSSHLGKCSVSLMIYIIPSMLIGYAFIGHFPDLNVLSLLAVLISIILATTINTLLITFIGLLSFIIEDSHPFYWVYSKVILVLGTIFPIEFFPKVLQPIIKYSPVYVVSYGPAKLFVNFSWDNFVLILVAQIIYLIISYLFCVLMYRKGVRNLNVNGG